MEQETNQNEKISIDTTKEVKGKIVTNPLKAWKLPTPSLLARATDVLRYFSTAIIGLVSGSDMFTGGQAKKKNFGLSVFIVFLGGADRFIGVEPAKRNTIAGWIIVLTFYLLS